MLNNDIINSINKVKSEFRIIMTKLENVTFLNKVADYINLYLNTKAINGLVELTQTGTITIDNGFFGGVKNNLNKLFIKYLALEQKTNDKKETESSYLVLKFIAFPLFFIIFLWFLGYLLLNFLLLTIFISLGIIPLAVISNNQKKSNYIRPDLLSLYKKLNKEIETINLLEYLVKYNLDIKTMENDLKINIDYNVINDFDDNILGTILTYDLQPNVKTTKEDKDYKINKSTDSKLKNYSTLPFFSTNIAKYVNNNQIQIIIDYSLAKHTGSDREQINIPSFKDYLIQMDLETSFSDLKLEKEKKYLKSQGFTDKGVEILLFLANDENKKIIKMYPKDMTNIIKNKYYIQLEMKLSAMTRGEVRKQAEYIGSKVGITPKVIPSKKDNYVHLKFKFDLPLEGRKMVVADMIEQANKGIINLGITTDGDFEVVFPRGDSPFFVLIGGISRSGKSTLATRFITTALLLNDGNGFYDYEHVFIGSKKADEDYRSLGWDKQGMWVEDNPLKQFEMLEVIDKYMYNQKNIIAGAGCTNIAEYNAKNPNNKMGKVLLIMDEYKNTMTTAENMSKIDFGDSKIKLNEAIEKKLTLLNSEHGSRGLNTIVITQSFAKNGVGRVRDTLGSQILGYADKDIWNSIDTTQEMSKHLNNKNTQRQGLFYVKAPDFEEVKTGEFDTISGYVEIKTHYHDNDELTKHFNRQFLTVEKIKETLSEEQEEILEPLEPLEIPNEMIDLNNFDI